MTKFTLELIAAAIEGFEAQKARIDQQIAELRGMKSGTPDTAVAKTESVSGKARKFSAAARQKMRDAQQRRWAKKRGEAVSSTPAAPKEVKAKRTMSEEGRQRIIAATKKRWADKKAADAVASPEGEKPAMKKAGKKK